ncbi:MAG: hypothetical protein R3A79_25420, partial [Nannocystaceae bacterium]
STALAAAGAAPSGPDGDRSLAGPVVGYHETYRINEIQSLVDYRYMSLSVAPEVFPGLSHGAWSATTRAMYVTGAMTVNFEAGTTYAPSKEDAAATARFVHDP